MTGDMNKAEEWLNKASDYVKSGSDDEMVLKYYITQFIKRKDEFGKLNIQWDVLITISEPFVLKLYNF